jgi:methionyl-tRNA formyltransferase
MKIVFFGTSEFAVLILDSLLGANFNIEALVTVPDQPMGRNKIITPPPIKRWNESEGIPIFQPNTLKDDQFFEQFKSLKPDLAIVAAYGKIIPEKYLSIPKYFINVHPSLLPKYRGPSPIQSAILNNENQTGITIMQVDKETDHGPIFLQKEVVIRPDETFEELHNQLARDGGELLIEALKNIDSIKPKEQDHLQATFTKMFERMDSKINWDKSSQEIYNQIRALNPEPGTWTTWQNQILAIISGKPIEIKNSEKPGTVIKIDSKIAVATGDGALELLLIRLASKKPAWAAEFSQGHKDFVGSKLE